MAVTLPFGQLTELAGDVFLTIGSAILFLVTVAVVMTLVGELAKRRGLNEETAGALQGAVLIACVGLALVLLGLWLS